MERKTCDIVTTMSQTVTNFFIYIFLYILHFLFFYIFTLVSKIYIKSIICKCEEIKQNNLTNEK